MNPLLHAANLGSGNALVAFFIAFVLTLWPGRMRTSIAAVLYALGTWVSLGFLARNYLILVQIGYGASDSGSANSAASFWLLIPVIAVIYALAAPALLWPSIPQATAMRHGKILNLAAMPLLAAVMFVTTTLTAAN